VGYDDKRNHLRVVFLWKFTNSQLKNSFRCYCSRWAFSVIPAPISTPLWALQLPALLGWIVGQCKAAVGLYLMGLASYGCSDPQRTLFSSRHASSITVIY
jgi:hypothetical protein